MMTEQELVRYHMIQEEEQKWNKLAKDLYDNLYQLADKLNLDLGQMNKIYSSLFSKGAGAEEITGYVEGDGYYFVFADTRCYRTIFSGYTYEEARNYLAKEYANDIAYQHSLKVGNPYEGCDYRVFWFENVLKLAARIQSPEAFTETIDYYEKRLSGDNNWKYNSTTEKFDVIE